MAGANCWGVTFDDYGQVFHKSGDRPHGYWTVPGMVRGGNPSGSSSATEASVSYRNSPGSITRLARCSKHPPRQRRSTSSGHRRCRRRFRATH